jgi:hypothetical protein
MVGDLNYLRKWICCGLRSKNAYIEIKTEAPEIYRTPLEYCDE